jgi:hypothetical protein
MFSFDRLFFVSKHFNKGNELNCYLHSAVLLTFRSRNRTLNKIIINHVGIEVSTFSYLECFSSDAKEKECPRKHTRI